MVEHRNFYSDVERASIPDRIYPDESGVILGLVVGKETIRQIRVPNITGTKEFVTSVIKRPVVAVMRDSNGNNYCEPYDTSLHGEERELEHIPADELLHNEDFFDVWECVEEALAEGPERKVMNIEDEWRSRGGNPSFKMPKKVYSANKLK